MGSPEINSVAARFPLTKLVSRKGAQMSQIPNERDPNILHELHSKDGIDRRGFLKCMAWAGTGVLWSISGGILQSQTLNKIGKDAANVSGAQLDFVQINDNGKLYRERFGKGTKGSGWYSFDQKGVHFIGLVNVMDIKEGGLGVLGHE